MILEEINIVDAPSGTSVLLYGLGAAAVTVGIGLLFCS